MHGGVYNKIITGEMVMKYTITEAEEEDSEVIEELARICPPLRGGVCSTYEYLAICFKRYFLIAKKIDEAIGFIVGFPNIDKKNEGEVWIYQIAVCPKDQGLKIGFDLLTEELLRFSLGGYKKVKARILDSNYQSLGLFKKMGFEEIEKKGEWIEVEKRLD